MAAMVIWLLDLATKQTMMQNTGGMLAMTMESSPVSLKTNWKAPGWKTHRETKIINTDLQGKVGLEEFDLVNSVTDSTIMIRGNR